MKMRMALKTTITPAIRFGASDLLQYSPKYSLLICRECQYAIPKKKEKRAHSHSLRYKIYRGDIQRLPSSIAQKADPLEPHLVPLPLLFRHPSMPSLPILSGYRRTPAGYRRFTTSSARMKSHWTGPHGLGAFV